MQRLVHGRGECGEGAKAGGSLEEGGGGVERAALGTSSFHQQSN